MDREQPWTSLPPSLTPLLMPHLAEVTQELLDAVREDVPVYARPLEGLFGDGIRQGVDVALTRFLHLPGTHQPALQDEDRRVYEGLGRGEVREGRPMDALFAAYRSGARTTLRSLSRVAMEAGFEASVLIGLAESVFAYIEELSAASAEGYAAEQSERAGERDRLLDTVAEMLIRGNADEESVRAAVHAAGWILPERVVVVTLPADRRMGLRSRLGRRALLTSRPGDVVAVVPEPASPTARQELGRVLAGRAAVVGPGRPWQAAPDSLRLAVMARELLAHDPDGEGPLWVSERLAELVLLGERTVVEDLGAQRLAPLERLRPAQQERLVATLLSWLKHHGQRAAMAAELVIHEQTVGYRVNQLREIFGEALNDPQARFELELVLRARAL
ncbi:helix-turn-helix domain-containing protein [Kocuria rosea]|uniref:PucR family transcriptional regulator n=1 Tax=Kocuria rosea TaxID=1275 RepID=UPI002041111A|nr:helix-turn-helix domain-containing protein [Kocuria rosea]MCM3686887.1 helix-turn-helix domain-containing protein [Kocuria rosea]